ncbi:hypothetical protein DPMN_122276 [Dreissena polymorpha]|uniref:Cytochrome P450 n=2 Tax=Dreissena polymorpha TaxID=45954 RepID=A0A9D4GV66_DREPO|nr:hypothetical protein DPMN_122276 [Dreissena polymorpha]
MRHQFNKRRFFRLLGVQCANTYPLFGCLPEAMKMGVLSHDIWSIRKYGRVFGTYLGNLPNLVVADPKLIREIFVCQFHKFPQRMQALYISEWWDNCVVMAKGDHWRYMRSIITPAFNSVALRNMHTRTETCLEKLTTFLTEKVNGRVEFEFDMRTLFGALTLDILCYTSFGQETNNLKNENNEFSRHAKILSTLNIETNALNGLPMILPFTKPVFRFLRLDYVNTESLNYIKKVIEDMISFRSCQNGMHKDTLQNLVNATGSFDDQQQIDDGNTNLISNPFKTRKHQGLNQDEIIANAIVVLMAGYDTTATTLTWMAYLLATNMDVQLKLVKSIDEHADISGTDYDSVMKLDYLDWFLSETLRLYPAANRTGRDTDIDTEVCGLKVRRGLSITVPIYAIHRMPEYWSEPEKCIPERFSPENMEKIIPFTYLPFGVGPRACLGIKMAKMLCKVIMVKVLQMYTFHVCSKTEINPVLETSLLTKPKNGLWLTLRKR